MSALVVAAPSDLAARVGAGVGRDGGGLVDALIGATMTAMCSEPGVCAPGGGGYLTVGIPGYEVVSIDGYMAMPGRNANPNASAKSYRVSMEYGGGTTTDVGPGSIAVPGAFAAFWEAHQRWGVMPWREVFAHVADGLVDGFPLPKSCRYYLEHSGESVFGVDPASREALFDGARLREAGETIIVPGMVETLRHIGDAGAESFYRGDLASAIVSDLSERGSLITRSDLADYRAVVGPALTSRFSQWTLATTPPPAVGGVTLSAILRMVEASPSPLDPTVWERAQRTAYRLRAEKLDVAEDRVRAGREVLSAVGNGRSGSTVSISVAGADGGVAAATMSGGYGSGVIPRGTGLWMNNSLGELELNPDEVRLPAGERLISNMAPTVAIGSDRRVAIGSPGADRITSALATSLTLILAGYGLAAAIEHPRLHVEHHRSRVAVESGLAPVTTDWPVREYDALDMFFGGVTAAEIGPAGLVGHADSRRTGGVITSPA